MSQPFLPNASTQPGFGRAPVAAPIIYLCAGNNCGKDNMIKPREPIRCQECGCRVMYKKRIKRSTLLTLKKKKEARPFCR
ncbi:DNA-directed RNA polymerase II subunit K [Puccinia sorghi]|uniref:DNA-directed RNA polymerase II subunit K n=1 Tax=Puccinia sorghi TaxID=27349 RepID=A0A0L6UEF9_9BASI|nr:DNA-directed RNA polymerase II subunit K [Puccinia sorghi]